MKISILTVGKIKEKYLRDAIAEYSKRLGRYCKLEIIEVSDEKTPDNASETVEDAIRNKEGERLLKYIRDDAFVITLEIGGEQLTSENFARKINELGIRGTSHIQFRRLYRSWKRSTEEIRLCFKLFEDDISSSADACDSSGTDLPQLSYHQRRALS
jgi:hypothetical protein